MLTSSSTSASYYSAASVLEANDRDRDRDNSNSSSHVINGTRTNPNETGRTVEIAIEGDEIELDYLKNVSGDIKHSNTTDAKDNVDNTRVTLEPRISVVSQRSSDTSVSTQSGYTDSVVSGYSESIVSRSTSSTERSSGQSDSTDSSWNADSVGKPPVKSTIVKIEPVEEESASVR